LIVFGRPREVADERDDAVNIAFDELPCAYRPPHCGDIFYIAEENDVRTQRKQSRGFLTSTRSNYLSAQFLLLSFLRMPSPDRMIGCWPDRKGSLYLDTHGFERSGVTRAPA
jgi:hypothetical protein